MVIVWFYIRDFFTMIWELIKHIADLIVSLIQLIWSYGQTAIRIVGVLPSIFITVGVVSIVIMVLYKILNRNSKEDD